MGSPQKSLPTSKPCLVPSPNEESPESRSGHRQCLQAPRFLPAFISSTVWEGASEDLFIAFPWKFHFPNVVDD